MGRYFIGFGQRNNLERIDNFIQGQRRVLKPDRGHSGLNIHIVESANIWKNWSRIMTQAFNLAQLANHVNTSGQLDASTALYNDVPIANGGTGLTSLTTGYIPFGAGNSSINSDSNLFWDNTNKTLKLGSGTQTFVNNKYGNYNIALGAYSGGIGGASPNPQNLLFSPSS